MATLGSSLKGSKLTSVSIVHLAYPAIELDIFTIQSRYGGASTYATPPSKEGWTLLFVAWLKYGTIPPEEDAKAFRMKASRYTLTHHVFI